MANDSKDDIIIAMLEEQKSLLKNMKSPQVDLTKIDNLAERKPLFTFIGMVSSSLKSAT